MKISWVFAAGYSLDPLINIEHLKETGPTWGSWRSWRSCSTDNVICHDLAKCKELVQRNFHQRCNFYMPTQHYADLGRPTGVHLYNGDFVEQTVELEDIIAMHLVSRAADIVLLAGFDFTTPKDTTDQLEQHRIRNQHGLTRAIILRNPKVQWVAVDTVNLDQSYQSLDNLSCDSMENVLQLL